MGYKGANEQAGGGAMLQEMGEINASAKGLFRLAQLTGHSSTLAPGACKKCGQVGHLYFQCRNWVKLKERDVQEEVVVEEEDPDSDAMPSSDDDNDSSSDDESSSDSSDSDESSSSGSSSS